MAEEKVYIGGLDKVELLKRLWSNQKVAAFFAQMPWATPQFDAALALEAVTRDIDYFCGRAIKTDLSGDMAETRLYDLDAGQGVFAQIVATMRNV